MGRAWPGEGRVSGPTIKMGRISCRGNKNFLRKFQGLIESIKLRMMTALSVPSISSAKFLDRKWEVCAQETSQKKREGAFCAQDHSLG